MGVFEFVIILVLIISLTEAATKIMVPVARRLAEHLAESAKEKRQRREALGGGTVPPELLDELDRRLARIEDRLDFLEELRAPDRYPALSSPDRSGRDR